MEQKNWRKINKIKELIAAEQLRIETKDEFIDPL